MNSTPLRPARVPGKPLALVALLIWFGIIPLHARDIVLFSDGLDRVDRLVYSVAAEALLKEVNAWPATPGRFPIDLGAASRAARQQLIDFGEDMTGYRLTDVRLSENNIAEPKRRFLIFTFRTQKGKAKQIPPAKSAVMLLDGTFASIRREPK